MKSSKHEDTAVISKSKLIALADQLRIRMDNEDIPEMFFAVHKNLLVTILLELERVAEMCDDQRASIEI